MYLLRWGGVPNLTIYTKNEKVTLPFNLAVGSPFKKFHNRELANLLKIILSSFKIDLVHVHHSLFLSLDVFYEAAKQNIPIIASLHDFYSVCPNHNLLDYNYKYCFPKDDLDYCAECLWKKLKISKLIPNYLQKWRSEYIRAFSLCKELFIPSQSAKDIVLHFYPDLKEKLTVIEHGSNSFQDLPKGKIKIDDRIKSCFDQIKHNLIEGWIFLSDSDSKENNIVVEVSNSSGFQKRVFVYSKPRPDVAKAHNDNRYVYSGFRLPLPLDLLPQGALSVKILVEHKGELFSDGKEIKIENKHQARKNLLNIAFIGAIHKIKGEEMIASLIQKNDSNFTWHTFGEIALKDWPQKMRNFPNYYSTFGYKREHLQSLIDFYSIDLICTISIGPETFAYTLSEALLCGVPVIATDLGALGERVKKMDCGWVISPDDSADEIINLLQRLGRDSDEYKNKKAKVQSLKMKNVREMTDEYRQKYISLMKNSKPEHPQISTDDIKLITDEYLKELYGLNVQQNVELETLRQKEISLNFELENLKQRSALLDDICNSLSFKLMLRLKKLLPAPIKYPLKACALLLRKIYRLFR